MACTEFVFSNDRSAQFHQSLNGGRIWIDQVDVHSVLRDFAFWHFLEVPRRFNSFRIATSDRGEACAASLVERPSEDLRPETCDRQCVVAVNSDVDDPCRQGNSPLSSTR